MTRDLDFGWRLTAGAAALLFVFATTAHALTIDELAAQQGAASLGVLRDATEVMATRAQRYVDDNHPQAAYESYRSDANRLLTAFGESRRTAMSVTGWRALERAVEVTKAPQMPFAAKVQEFAHVFDRVGLEWDVASHRLFRTFELAERYHFARQKAAARNAIEEAVALLKELHCATQELAMNRRLAPLLQSNMMFSERDYAAAGNALVEALRYSPDCAALRLPTSSVCPAGDHEARLAELKPRAADDPTLSALLGYHLALGGKLSEAKATLSAASQRWPDRGYLSQLLNDLDAWP